MDVTIWAALIGIAAGAFGYWFTTARPRTLPPMIGAIVPSIVAEHHKSIVLA
jgi:hypothetical protein